MGPTLTRVLSVDPGDKFCGLALFLVDGDGVVKWTVWEATPDQTADYVAGVLRAGYLNVLVVERFQLYGDKAQQQTGSQMHTPELIGVLKYLWRIANQRHTVTLALQGANLQRPMVQQLKARKITSRAVGMPHGRSAELHGFHFIGQHLLGWGGLPSGQDAR